MQPPSAMHGEEDQIVPIGASGVMFLRQQPRCVRKLLKILGWSIVVIVVPALGAYGWASWQARDRYDKQWTAHDAGFPIPFPLRDAETATLRDERIAAGAPATDPPAGVDLSTRPGREFGRERTFALSPRARC